MAAANYAGYLVGALACTLWRPRALVLVRVGLAAVAVLTAAMALVPGFTGWLLLRFGAGIASAAVFVGVSVLTVAAGSYAGVGSGIALAGLLVLAVGQLGGSSTVAWVALGALAAVLAATAWRPTSEQPPAPPRTPGPLPSSARRVPTATPRRLVLCYGALGLGYILPATFLPATARDLVPDPRCLRLGLAGLRGRGRHVHAGRGPAPAPLRPAAGLGARPHGHGRRRAGAGGTAGPARCRGGGGGRGRHLHGRHPRRDAGRPPGRPGEDPPRRRDDHRLRGRAARRAAARPRR